MAPGLVTIREQFGPKHGIEEFIVIVGSMNFTMAIDARQFGSQPTVLSAVFRRDRVALQTKPVARLFEKHVVGRTVRLMTLNTPSAFDEVAVNNRMLERKRTGLIAVATLTGPVQSLDHFGSLNARNRVAADTFDIAGVQRMSRTQHKFGLDLGMTGDTEIITVSGRQLGIGVVVDLMAGCAFQPSQAMDVLGHHSRLMRRDMTPRTDFRLLSHV